MMKLFEKIKQFFSPSPVFEESESFSPVGKAFKQTCVFAHSERVGDKRIFKMQSGSIYLVKLVEIDNPYNHSADDTAQRDLTWMILDEVHVTPNNDGVTLKIDSPLYGNIDVYQNLFVLKTEADAWKEISDMFIKIYFPEQNEGVRFLRGA